MVHSIPNRSQIRAISLSANNNLLTSSRSSSSDEADFVNTLVELNAITRLAPAFARRSSNDGSADIGARWITAQYGLSVPCACSAGGCVS